MTDKCACGVMAVPTRTGFGAGHDGYVHSWLACVVYRDRSYAGHSGLRGTVEDAIHAAVVAERTVVEVEQ